MLDGYICGHPWFVIFLLGTGVYFTIYLRFPQLRYFGHAIDVVKGKYDHHLDIGDTSHFQALTTALSGTVGTGNIAGVALAIHLGGPAALFWMLVTALIGMCTKFVEVLISHKYRDILQDGTVSGGPMYYMKKRLNITTKSGKVIKTGTALGVFFAIGTVLSAFGTGSLPQINSISNSIYATFGIRHIITGAVLAFVLGLIIIGGIKRIAKVTSSLVPFMAFFYVVGGLLAIVTNYENIVPAFISIFSSPFNGTSAVGGFLGASFAFAVNRGVNRGLFSNEAGQGSAPIAHASAKAPEPVSEGMVAILEPFIDTIVICTLTGLIILSSGVWNEKIINQFQSTDMVFLDRIYNENDNADKQLLSAYMAGDEELGLYNGVLDIDNGNLLTPITLIASRSVAEDMVFTDGGEQFTGEIDVIDGRWQPNSSSLSVSGKSLIHSAPLTAEAFTRSVIGDWGKYIVSTGLLLFAFSTALAWSYYGDRAVMFLFGEKYVLWFRIVFVVGFFLASFTDTTIIWSVSYITIAFMSIPNLVGLWLMRRDVRQTIADYWSDFSKKYPEDRMAKKYLKKGRL